MVTMTFSNHFALILGCKLNKDKIHVHELKRASTCFLFLLDLYSKNECIPHRIIIPFGLFGWSSLDLPFVLCGFVHSQRVMTIYVRFGSPEPTSLSAHIFHSIFSLTSTLISLSIYLHYSLLQRPLSKPKPNNSSLTHFGLPSLDFPFVFDGLVPIILVFVSFAPQEASTP